MADPLLPDKKPGDGLTAAHINEINRICELVLAMQRHGGGTEYSRTTPQPFLMSYVQIVTKNESDGPVSQGSSGSSFSAGPVSGIYNCRLLYYSHTLNKWQTRGKTNLYHLDQGPTYRNPDGLLGQLHDGDTLTAYWDPDRYAFVPVGNDLGHPRTIYGTLSGTLTAGGSVSCDVFATLNGNAPSGSVTVYDASGIFTGSNGNVFCAIEDLVAKKFDFLWVQCSDSSGS